MWGIVAFIIGCIVLYMADRELSGKPSISFHIPTQEEREAAEKIEQERSELISLGEHNDIFNQYTNHFYAMPFKSDFVKPEYVEYFEREQMLWNSMTKTQQKQALKRDANVTFMNNELTGWGNYCTAFGGERMIRDKKGLPYIVRSRLGVDWEKSSTPTETAVDKVWWFYWRRTHYPELIKKFNETGKFIPGWEWRPLDEIPDYHDHMPTI